MLAENTKIDDVTSKFDNLPKEGKHQKFKHLPYYGNIITEHVQGYTKCKVDGKTYSIFTHSGYDGPVIVTSDNGETKWEIKCGSEWSHPGGCQTLGQYVFVPCEHDGKSIVNIYDVAEIANSSSKDVKPKKTFSFSHEAACVGITNFRYGGKDCYLMIVVSKCTDCYAYIAEDPASGSFDDLNFKAHGKHFKLDNLKLMIKNEEECVDIKAQAIGLVTDVEDNVYMIVPMSRGSGLTYGDWIYLLPLNIGDRNVTIKRGGHGRHLRSVGGISGVDGSHFRWGAGIQILPDGRLAVMATSRNIIGLDGIKLDTTVWNGLQERREPDVLVEVPYGITDLKVIAGSSSDIQAPSGYSKLSIDLNMGAGGEYIYLCYKTGTADTREAITDIKVIFGKDAQAPSGYNKIGVDLNKGARGEYIYLCYKKGTSGFLKGLGVIAAEDRYDGLKYRGYDVIQKDLNKGAGGRFIYLCCKK